MCLWVTTNKIGKFQLDAFSLSTLIGVTNNDKNNQIQCHLSLLVLDLARAEMRNIHLFVFLKTFYIWTLVCYLGHISGIIACPNNHMLSPDSQCCVWGRSILGTATHSTTPDTPDLSENPDISEMFDIPGTPAAPEAPAWMRVRASVRTESAMALSSEPTWGSQYSTAPVSSSSCSFWNAAQTCQLSLKLVSFSSRMVIY